MIANLKGDFCVFERDWGNRRTVDEGSTMEFRGKEQADDSERLRREIEGLLERLGENAKKGKQLSCDTELLIKKTENLKQANKVSCAEPNWLQIAQSLEVGREGIWITDIATVEDIQIVAAFAAERELAMTYGNRSFHLEPQKPAGEL